MSKIRWAQFFWADWSNDTALNLCSIPARGLWMALLCLMAQGKPYGTLNIKGRVPSDDELFTLTCPRGTRRRDFNRWLAELETHGVAERDHTATLRSPRMNHDGAISLSRIDAAKASWKTAEGRQNPRDLHVQPDSAAAQNHDSSADFPSCTLNTDPKTKVKTPPVGPHAVGTGTPQAGTPPGRGGNGIFGGGGRKEGKNQRALGTNPRAVGTNSRANGTHLRANGTNPRASRNAMFDIIVEDLREAAIHAGRDTHEGRARMVPIIGDTFRGDDDP